MELVRRAVPLLAGSALAAGLGVVALVRRDRPLHAYGATCRGILAVDHPAGLGVPLLDETGAVDVVVRCSRAMSLSHDGPDILGLAIRLPDGGGDLLFASTGTSLLGRYVLRLHRDLQGGPMTTLLPARSPRGLVQLALQPEGDGGWALSWSRPATSRWTPVGTLCVSTADALPDPGHFDPTGRPPAGLTPPPWVRALRDPAYRTARSLVRVRAHGRPTQERP